MECNTELKWVKIDTRQTSNAIVKTFLWLIENLMRPLTYWQIFLIVIKGVITEEEDAGA